ncbi:MAG: hypothetical protein GY772_30475, partial [bacterium]|nr:hypothetical protein [bacterium]
MVGKAAQRKYIGRHYSAGQRDPSKGPELVDFYRRGLLDEPEPDRTWAPAWFHELPIYQPVTREYIAKHTWMDRVEFQGWPRELDETYTLMPRNPYQHEWRTLLRSCLVIEGAYVKRTTSASMTANMVNVVVRCTVCGTPFWGIVPENFVTASGEVIRPENLTMKDLLDYQVGEGWGGTTRMSDLFHEAAEHLKSKKHMKFWLERADMLSSVCGLLPRKTARHHGVEQLRTGCVMARVTGEGGKEYSVATQAMEGAPYPTVQDAMTNLGNPRGIVCLLWRAICDRRAGVVSQRSNEWFPVDPAAVDVLYPGLVYWRVAEMTEQYRGEESVFMTGNHLFQTTDE